ncbi:MAG: hypothetical protein SangKO_038460 [Sandaracinaceae bacterium]
MGTSAGGSITVGASKPPGFVIRAFGPLDGGGSEGDAGSDDDELMKRGRGEYKPAEREVSPTALPVTLG